MSKKKCLLNDDKDGSSYSMAAKSSFLSRWFGAAKESPAKVREPKVASQRQARVSGLGQPQYLATTLDVQRIQNALRSAERGDTWLLFTIFRDMYASYGHLQSEWSKRKCVITGNPETLIPHNPDDEDDVIACEVVAQMIDGCDNWFDGLNHLLDATLYPLAAAEKIFLPVGAADGSRHKYPLRYRLKEIAPIDPTLLCFKLPYVPSFASQDPTNQYNPDDWESWLRFYSTTTNGAVNYTLGNLYAPNPDVHIVHRGNMLSPVIPPNFGGHMRAILFPWLLATQGRDWFALLMQKYGMPIPVGKVNAQQKDSVAAMQEAFAMCNQLGGLVIDSKASVDWANVAATDSASAHRAFQEWLDSHTSRVVIGQSYSANPKNTGMGSGAASQSEEIREDYRIQDTMKLGDTLRRQLFRQFLEINGYRGNPPHVKWGGMRSGEAATFAKTLAANKSAGLRPTKRGLKSINEKFGIEYEIDPESKAPGIGRETNDINQEGSNPNKVKY